MSAAAVRADAGSVPLLGGELLGESDLDGADRYGDWLLPLLAGALPAAGRTLVLGRYDDSLLTALAARGTQVDLVLRSRPDATAARVRLAAAGVRVRCGGLAHIPVETGYDAVLAADDPAVLSGPDQPERPWPDTLAALAALARPGAPVVVLVPNPFGLDRLAHGEMVGTGRGTASRAERAGPDAGGAPDGLPAVPAALAAAGLSLHGLLAAYPGLVATAAALPPYDRAPATAARPEHHPAEPADEVPARLVADAYAAGHPGPVLTDPGRLAYRAVRHGLGLALAPSWIAVATRADPTSSGTAPTAAAGRPATARPASDTAKPAVSGTGGAAAVARPGPGTGGAAVARPGSGTGEPSVAAPAADAAESVAGPAAGAGEPAAEERPVGAETAAIVLADGGRPEYWAVPRVVRRSGAGWRAQPLRPDTTVRLLDHLRRDPGRLAGAVPVGESLAGALTAACRHGDLVAVRRLVAGYLAFLGAGAKTGTWRAVWSDDEPGEGVLCPADRVLATCDAVLVGPTPDAAARATDALEAAPFAVPDAARRAVPGAGPVAVPDAAPTAVPDGAPTAVPGAAWTAVADAPAAAGNADRGAGDMEPPALRLADPSWSSGLAVPVRLVFLRGLQRFAYRLLASGAPHPWPAGLSADRLAGTLAATADVTVSPGELADAAGLAVYLTAPLAADEPATGADADSAFGASPASGVPVVAGGTGPGEHAEALRYAAGQPRWAADPALAAVPPRGYAEALAAIGALSAELADARAQLGWLDATVAERDRRLSELGTLRRSVTYRVGYLATLPYHLGIRLLRRELRRLRRP